MITKDMSILEVLQKFPGSKAIFVKHGMSCLGCMGAEQESIETGARMHGINIEALMKELQDMDKIKSDK